MNQKLWQEHGAEVAKANRPYNFTAKSFAIIDAETKKLHEIIDNRRNELDAIPLPDCLRKFAI